MVAPTRSAGSVSPPFDAGLLDRLMEDAGLDVILATSKHNVQYLLGGHRYFFFDYMDAIGTGRYLPVVLYVRGDVSAAAYIGNETEGWQLDNEPLWVPAVELSSWGSVDAVEAALTHLRRVCPSGVTVGVERSFLPTDSFARLADERDLRFAEAFGVLERLRARKSAAELATVERASDAIVESMCAVFASHGAGATRSGALRRASPAFAAAEAQAREAVEAGVPVLLVGEPGTGKLTLAARLLQGARSTTLGPDGSLPDGAEAVVVPHIDALPPGSGPLVEQIAADGTTRLVATAHDVEHIAPELRELFALATVTVPPLRDRPEDLRALVVELTARQERPARWSTEALDALARRSWAGNIRELENVVTRTLINSSGLIRVADLPLDVRQEAGGKRLTRMERAERDAIMAALATSSGNKAIAAEELGISRSSLYRKISRYGLADSGQVDMRMRS